MVIYVPNWVLIPCRNNATLLSSAIKSVLAQNIPDVRIFAINNGSTDNTAQVLGQLHNGHIVVNRYPQIGVAGAWNLGLSYLFNKEQQDSVLVINQDVILPTNLFQTLKDEKGEFVTAVSVNNKKDLRNELGSKEKRPHPDFSCFLIKRSCWDTVGPFDESYFPAWYEDNDYHVRMHRAGIGAYCVDIPFYHVGAGTLKLASEDEKVEYTEAFQKSENRFIEKYGCKSGTPEYSKLFI